MKMNQTIVNFLKTSFFYNVELVDQVLKCQSQKFEYIIWLLSLLNPIHIKAYNLYLMKWKKNTSSLFLKYLIFIKIQRLSLWVHNFRCDLIFYKR